MYIPEAITIRDCTKIVQKWRWSRFSRSHILPPLRLTTAQGAVYTTLAGVAEFVPYDTTPSMGRGQASQLL